jgi:hypothetical protein
MADTSNTYIACKSQWHFGRISEVFQVLKMGKTIKRRIIKFGNSSLDQGLLFFFFFFFFFFSLN